MAKFVAWTQNEKRKKCGVKFDVCNLTFSRRQKTRRIVICWDTLMRKFLQLPSCSLCVACEELARQPRACYSII